MDLKLIKNRIENFLGYGNLNSEIWFIGMEEGSSNEYGELLNRFESTYNKETIDIRDLRQIKEHMKWFSENKPKLQRTWDKLIQIILFLEQKEFLDLEIRREYQKYHLCSKNSNHCLLELSSLPATNTSTWPYKKISNLNYLSSRKEYKKTILPKRVNLIIKKINEYQPKLVIFYSKTYSKYWNEIIKNSTSQTKFHIIPHPVARNMDKNNWIEIFKEIKG